MKKIFDIIQKIICIIRNILIIFLIIICIYYNFQLYIRKLEREEIFDYIPYIVTSGSMQKTIGINDIIIVKVTEDVKENDIIAFKTDETFIVHRIVSKNSKQIITKGDYNNQIDEPIIYEQVIGKVIYIIQFEAMIFIILSMIIFDIIIFCVKSIIYKK